MAMGLDLHVFQTREIREHVEMDLTFVGYFDDWSTDKITDCQTSSGWSECIVNAYHLCGREVAPAKSRPWAWWDYSACMYSKQYPLLECASPNPWANSTCTAAEFPSIAAGVSDACASQAAIEPSSVRACVEDGRGLRLLKQSFRKTVTFPKNPKTNKTEPQWMQVQGPECGAVGWEACQASFDKTFCTDWDACDSKAWALHIRADVCKAAGLPCAT